MSTPTPLASPAAQAAYDHDGAPTHADAFYAVACDPRRSVAVEACAGAGKTWMLVSRIVRALLDQALADPQGRVRPQEILAITFTKKAAGEMRARLDEWLAHFATLPQPQLADELRIRGVDLSQIGPQAASRLPEQLSKLQQAVLEAGRPVQLRTFHSWFAALLQTAPIAVREELGLPVVYELLEDDGEAVAAVWPRFYAGVRGDAEAAADYQELVAEHGRHNAGHALAAALDRRTEFALADAAGAVARSVQPWRTLHPQWAGLDGPDAALQGPLFAEAAVRLGRASAATFSAKGAALEQALAAADADGVLDALLTKDCTPRKFGEKITGIERIREAQAVAVEVVAARRQQAAHAHQQRMARLTRRLCADYAQLKRDRGWVDMNDVERAAHALLADPVLAGWVQERLDARIRHLLVDEFQDTNPLQWQALHAWLSGYAGAGGGQGAPSVFIVGDPKQSIYRFRRAEPQVFRAAQRFVVDALGGSVLRCDHTRRNAPAVLASVNGALGAAVAAGDYAGFRAHTTGSGDAGAALRLPIVPRPPRAARGDDLPPAGWRDSLTEPRERPEDTLRTLEARQAAAWLAATLAAEGLQPGDAMVLARKRDRLGAMQAALQALGVPAQQPEKQALGERPEVQDLVALVDALVSPGNDLALARALRSPLFRVAPGDLVALALARRAQPGVPWLDLMPGIPALADAAATLARWQGWVRALPPHDALSLVFDDGAVLARYAAATPAAMRPAVVANLRALPRAALEIGGGRFATPYAFVRAMKRGGPQAPVPAGEGAVRLLTVHGAKGLEAPLVLLLDTDPQPAAAEHLGVLVDWPGEAAAPRRFVFLAHESRPPACCADVLETEQAARRTEELNGLYVAMTRARHRLVLSAVEPHRADAGSWWRRVAGLVEESPLPAAAVPAVPAEPAEPPPVPDTPFLMPNLPAARIQTARSAMETVATEADRANAVGQAMHRLLEWAPRRIDAEAQAAVAREFRLDAPAAAQAVALAERVLAGAGAWAFDATQLAWSGSEVAIAHQGQLLRIDRLVQRADDGSWWVLDHKSAAAPERLPALRAQLARYRDAVAAARPGATVHAAFLTGQGALVPLAT